MGLINAFFCVLIQAGTKKMPGSSNAFFFFLGGGGGVLGGVLLLCANGQS